ncbi:MAG: polyketide synthase, partial [Rubrivivax sp.]|nr:polyketide synthase [Rubrivivax sp.]
MQERIAVVAAACEFAHARTPQQLWRLALHGRQGFRRLPPQRLALGAYLRGDDDADGLYPIEAGLLEGYKFDRARFLVPLQTFAGADMAHWLALDLADRAIGALPGGALADASLKDRTAVVVANTLTGEFSRANSLRYRWPYVEARWREAAAGRLAGADTEALLADFERRFKQAFPPPDADSLAGGLSNTIAGRIANHFGLRGGAHAVDGACASLLVGVVAACDRLRGGDVDLAVVAAVDLSLDPFELVGFARNSALARGEMRVFDADATGFWPGEGGACVILATAALAHQRGWPVLGWVLGTGMSTDGQGGLTRPTAAGQLLALRRAWSAAGLDAAMADYFEAHGTGTPTGDPVELDALAQAIAESGGAPQPIPVGSIKANIGHTKAAAGMAGLLQALAVATERLVPPLAGGHEPHPLLAHTEIQ